MAWINGHKEIVQKPKYEILFFLRKDHEGDQKLADRVHERMAELVPNMNYIITSLSSIPSPTFSLISSFYSLFFLLFSAFYPYLSHFLLTKIRPR